MAQREIQHLPPFFVGFNEKTIDQWGIRYHPTHPHQNYQNFALTQKECLQHAFLRAPSGSFNITMESWENNRNRNSIFFCNRVMVSMATQPQLPYFC